MTRCSPEFELSVEDVDLIEQALQQTSDVLSRRQLSQEHMAAIEEGVYQDKARQSRERLDQIHELLGRLRNQKVFGGFVLAAAGG